MDQLMISVVVPCFNRLELLKQTMASLSAQTLDHAEFIVVDDGSDEPTKAFLDALPGGDDRFRIIHKTADQPRGCQVSRNLGLDAARGQAVMFLDSDDLIAPSCLEERWQAMQTSGADIVVGRQAIVHADEDKINWVNIPKPSELDLDRCLDLRDPFDVPWVNGSVILRLDKIRAAKVRWTTQFHWDDLAFHFQCLAQGLTVHWLELDGATPDFFYILHGNEHFSDRLSSVEGRNSTAAMLLWMADTLKQTGRWNEQRQQRLARSYFHICLLRLIDARDYSGFNDWLIKGRDHGVIGAVLHRCLRRFVKGRRFLRASRTLTYHWNQSFRQGPLKELFVGEVWTLAATPAPEPASHDRLRQLQMLPAVTG